MNICIQSKLYFLLYHGALIQTVSYLHNTSDTSEIVLRYMLYYKITTNTAYF
jgi:hypothetical protein